MWGSTVASHLSLSLRALRHRNFRLYWSAQLVSLAGTWMQTVAQGWLMHRLTGSAFMLGLLGFCQFLPVLAFSLWAGVVADHMDRRKLVAATQTAALVQATALAAVVSAGVVRPWMVLALGVVFGVINAFDLPARQTFTIDLAGREDLSNAIALNSMAFNAARVLGPAAAGILLASVGEAGCFWLNALSFLPVLAALALMDLPTQASSGRLSARSTLGEGVRYAFGVGPIRNLLLLLGLTAGFGFQYMVLLPVYARDLLGGGPETYGLLVSAFGVGALLSSVRLTQQLDRQGLRLNLLIGLMAGSAGLGVFAWSRQMPLSLAAGFLAGFGLIVYVASTNTLLQITTEDRFRGRVMSLYTFLFVGISPIGSLLTGWIGERLGAPAATSLSALVLLAGALIVIYRLRALAARRAPLPTEPVLHERLD